MSELYTQRTARVVARNRVTLLNSTSATTVITFTPEVSGQYFVGCYGIVQTAATDLTVTVAYTDPTTGNAETLTLVDGTSQAVGPVSFLGLIEAQGGGTVTVSATAGTASQITLTPVVVALP